MCWVKHQKLTSGCLILGMLLLLKGIRIQNLKDVIIGHLNINSLRYKFHALVDLIQGNLDILVVGETKLDDTFPEQQFKIKGYKKPYRLDRNGNGGGVIIYVRDDIPSQQLKKHNLPKSVEAIFIEINLRKSKFLLIGTYRPSGEGARRDISPSLWACGFLQSLSSPIYGNHVHFTQFWS